MPLMSEHLEQLATAQRAVSAAEKEFVAQRQRRDRLIAAASQEGMTAYKIAKATGLAESTVGRIIKNHRAG